MKMNLLSLVAATVFFLGVQCADATVIYDWVTTSTTVTSYGLRVSASYELTDSEYLDGTFEKNWLEVPLMNVWIQANDGSTATIISRPWSQESTTVYGVLSADRKKIDMLTSYNLYYGNNNVVYHDTDFIARADVTSISGGFDPMVLSLTGYVEGYFDVLGEWALREGTAPAVPEPGTFVLAALGFGVLAFWRRAKAVKH